MLFEERFFYPAQVYGSFFSQVCIARTELFLQRHKF